MTKLKILFSVEFYFIIFLFSGSFKESVKFPIDLTIVFLFLTLLISIWKFIKKPIFKKDNVIPLLLAFVLMIIILLSLFIKGTSSVAIVKVVKFVSLTLPAFILPILFIEDRKSIERLLLSISILAVVLSLFSLPEIISNTKMFIGFNGGNYLGLARILGIGFITLSYFAFIKEKVIKGISILCLALVGFVLISTGSRMPILALILIVSYFLFNSFSLKKNAIVIKKKYFKVSILIIFTTLVVLFMSSKGYFETTFYRFSVFFTDDGGASVTSRIDRIDSAIRMFNDNMVLGGGFGRFGDYFFEVDGQYAHNILLEFLSEMGVIGLLWIILFIGYAIYCSVYVYKKKNKRLDAMQLTIIAGFIFFFLNSMVSGDINENRALFSFISILMISSSLKLIDITNPQELTGNNVYK